MDSKNLALLCRQYADDKKGEDIVILDVRKISSITDYFVIVTGSSEPHLRAIADAILDGLRTEHGQTPNRTDGSPQDPWRVLDYFDVIVHIMRQETRELYDLEGLWGDAPALPPLTPPAPVAQPVVEKPVLVKPAAEPPAAKPVLLKTTVRKLPVSKPILKKAPAKKSPAKKTVAKKATVKKAPAKKVTAKKTPAKAKPAKKTAIKKKAVKKAPAKKPAAKKKAAKKK